MEVAGIARGPSGRMLDNRPDEPYVDVGKNMQNKESVVAVAENDTAKIGQKVVRKHMNKKNALVDSASQSLARLGYSECNLRTIAADAGVSLGTIHYYFADKDELLKLCVVRIKEDFLTLIRNVLISAEGKGGDAANDLTDALVETIENSGETHRLWYDLRTQAMYSAAFRDEVRRLEKELAAMLGVFFETEGATGLDGRLVYLQLDAIFRHWLVRAMTEGGDWKDAFKRDFLKVLNSALMSSHPS